jgi:histone acetyltransferase (RNA polymerase elongator complex component)
LDNIQIKEIKFQSESYYKLLAFRFENLRKPLNLEWTKKELIDEKEQIHFALIKRNEVIGSFCLKKISNLTIKLRQMAIKKDYQKKGYGSKLLKFAENYANKNNYYKIVIIARISALDFYRKNFFEVSGKKFIDVTVYSIKMFKNI